MGSEHFVQSLARGLEVIRAFDANHPRLTSSDVAQRCGMTRSAARRFLLTLADLGYVRVDGSHFALSPQVLKLGYAYLSSASLPDVAQPHLQALVDLVQDTASLCVLDGANITNIARVLSRRLLRDSHGVGAQSPAFASASGRVLLAHLDRSELARHLPDELRELTPKTITSPADLHRELARVFEQGYAVVDGELVDGLKSVSVPVHNHHGKVIAAINVSAFAGRTVTPPQEAELVKALRDTARGIENDLHPGSASGETAPRARNQ